MNWAEIIGGIFGGGSIVAALNYFRDSKKDRSEEIFKVLDEYKEMLTNLRKMEVECKDTLKKYDSIIADLQKTIADLKAKIILLESANNDLPFPMWLKDVDSVMLYVNDVFVETFLKPVGKTAQDYIGRTDIDVWGEEIGSIYLAADKKTLALKGKAYVSDDPVILNGMDFSNQWRAIRYLRFVGKVVVGIGGMAIPTFNQENK